MNNRRVLAAVAGVIFAISAYLVANSTESEWRSNEEFVTGAPQQQVAASWAIKDSAIAGVRMLGILGGLIIFSLSILSASPKDEMEEEKRRVAAGELKRCPTCCEAVRSLATVCRYCGRELAAPDPPPPPAETHF